MPALLGRSPLLPFSFALRLAGVVRVPDRRQAVVLLYGLGGAGLALEDAVHPGRVFDDVGMIHTPTLQAGVGRGCRRPAIAALRSFTPTAVYIVAVMNDTYRPAQLAVLWAVKDRQVRTILSELETLGFVFETDDYGARRVPTSLALAVQGARSKGQALSALRDEPDLAPYLRRGDDPLANLIELRTEVTILREVVGEVYRAMQLDASSLSYRPTDFKGLGVPDPRRGL